MYKTLDPTKDISQTDRITYTYAPLSGSIFESGTYAYDNKTYIRTYLNQIYSGSDSGSFFDTYYDRAITDSEAVSLFDMTFGISVSSSYYNDGTAIKDAKNRMYKMFAELCWGNPDARFAIDSVYYDELFFAFFKRNTFHDQIRKGYCTLYTVFAIQTA